MAAPKTKKLATLVSDFSAAAQAASQTTLDFTKGSVFLALAEASAGLGAWLQKLYLFALSVTRLTSSQGVWVDSFVSAFGMTRLAAAAATGLVNFTRYSAIGTITIPVGTQVATTDGTQVFQVVADTTNAAYSAASNGYRLLAGALTVPVKVQALTAGTGGNVSAGTITKLKSNVAGIDAVVNAAGFTNGIGQESDQAVKIRFPLFIASLRRATRDALSYAISALGLNLQSSFYEFTDTTGAVNQGMNLIYVDDGSGAPPAATVQAAAAAVDGYRAFGVRVGVLGASLLQANVQMTVTVAATYSAPAVQAAVVAAITNYINGLGLGAPLRFTRLEQIAYDTSPGVTNVSAITVNGGTSDLVPVQGQTIKTNNVLISTTS
jgi:uncharacterized phage protein gp47/JayE